MRLKLLSPEEMSADQKATYDEAIAGKRGRPPAPMMAWLNSPEMARHATRLGEVLRFNTIFPAKLSEIAILVTARHWTSHYEWFAHKRLALQGGMDPKIADDIRDRRTPTFDDPKAKMIYDVAKSLHEGHGVPKALYDAEHLRVRPARWAGVGTCVNIGCSLDGSDPAGEQSCRRIRPSSPAPGSAMFISKSPISIARWAFTAACSALN